MAKNDDGRDWLRSVTSKHQPTYYESKSTPAFWHPQPRKKRKNAPHGYGDKWSGIVWIIGGLIALSPIILLLINPPDEFLIGEFVEIFLVTTPLGLFLLWMGYQNIKYQ